MLPRSCTDPDHKLQNRWRRRQQPNSKDLPKTKHECSPFRDEQATFHCRKIQRNWQLFSLKWKSSNEYANFHDNAFLNYHSMQIWVHVGTNICVLKNSTQWHVFHWAVPTSIVGFRIRSVRFKQTENPRASVSVRCIDNTGADVGLIRPERRSNQVEVPLAPGLFFFKFSSPSLSAYKFYFTRMLIFYSSIKRNLHKKLRMNGNIIRKSKGLFLLFLFGFFVSRFFLFGHGFDSSPIRCGIVDGFIILCSSHLSLFNFLHYFQFFIILWQQTSRF